MRENFRFSVHFEIGVDKQCMKPSHFFMLYKLEVNYNFKLYH